MLSEFFMLAIVLLAAINLGAFNVRIHWDLNLNYGGCTGKKSVSRYQKKPAAAGFLHEAKPWSWLEDYFLAALAAALAASAFSAGFASALAAGTAAGIAGFSSFLAGAAAAPL